VKWFPPTTPAASTTSPSLATAPIAKASQANPSAVLVGACAVVGDPAEALSYLGRQKYEGAVNAAPPHRLDPSTHGSEVIPSAS
jgi:hypothetical protein